MFTEPDPRTNAAPLGFGNHVLLKTRNMHKRAVDLTLKEQNALDACDWLVGWWQCHGCHSSNSVVLNGKCHPASLENLVTQTNTQLVCCDVIQTDAAGNLAGSNTQLACFSIAQITEPITDI